MRTLLVLAFIAGCDGQIYSDGSGEPFQVRDATFQAGELPEGTAETPTVVNAASVGSIVTQGQGNISYSGLASPDTYAVNIGFPTVGTGYWSLPVDGPDVTQNGNLVFQFVADFTIEVPYGIQTVSMVAVDENTVPGPRYDTLLCILPEAAYGSLAACDEGSVPQNAVISLSWDTNVDLDLIVIAPNGKVVSSKFPTTALVDGTVPSDVLNDPSTGRLSRDSNSNCNIDGIRRESLVFPGEPPAGEYVVYASLHSACGLSHVRFAADLFRRVDAEDGTHPVEKTELAQGELFALNADGGASLGTRVARLTLP